MDDLAVQKQIEQMVQFIKQEAKEKANEILVQAEEEFNIQKLQTLEAEKVNIRKEYERKTNQVDIQKKIQYSKQVNEMRLRLLKARDEQTERVVAEAHKKLFELAKNKEQYKNLLIDLLVQSMKKLSEPAALIRAREIDLQIIKGIINVAKQKYQEIYKSQAPEIQIDESNRLQPPPKSIDQIGQEDALYCIGGVTLTSVDGRIVCANTLDSRLQISYKQNLPALRSKLFGNDSGIQV